MPKPCKYCQKTDHYSIQCFNKPRRPLRKIGKIGEQWIKARRSWISLHPPGWNCYLCGKKLNKDTLTLDHVKSRSRYPELRFELSNLQPACIDCNVDKGSRDIDELQKPV